MSNLLDFFKYYSSTKFVNKEVVVEIIKVGFRNIFIRHFTKVHFFILVLSVFWHENYRKWILFNSEKWSRVTKQLSFLYGNIRTWHLKWGEEWGLPKYF